MSASFLASYLRMSVVFDLSLGPWHLYNHEVGASCKPSVQIFQRSRELYRTGGSVIPNFSLIAMMNLSDTYGTYRLTPYTVFGSYYVSIF